MDSEGKFFGGAFESLARVFLRQTITNKLERLRSDDPTEWSSIKASLSKLGPYDRVEKINDLAESIAEALPKTEKDRRLQAHEYAKIILETLEGYFEEQGAQPNRLRNDISEEKTLPVHEAVKKLLASMGINWSGEELQ